MRHPADRHPTRTRRRALAVPFVVTFAAAGAACGAQAQLIPTVDRPPTTDVVSNPAPPDDGDDEVFISNPAPPEPDPQPDPDDEMVVIANPAFPEDG